MKKRSLRQQCGCLLLALSLVIHPLNAGAGLIPDASYSGDEATNDKVLALLQFSPDGPAVDSSPHGYQLQLRGEDTQFTSEGRFDGALQITNERQLGNDKPQGAAIKYHPELSPPGAFTLEMWIQPDEQLANQAVAVLLDKKYLYDSDPRNGGNCDYMLLLRKAQGQHRYLVEAQLGFGDDSEAVRSTPNLLNPDTWYHLAFTYDGHGACVFYLNGEEIGRKELSGREGLRPGKRGLVIGDRAGDRYARFIGKISEVRITTEALAFSPREAAVLDATSSRTAFSRMEGQAFVKVLLRNKTSQPLPAGEVTLSGPTLPQAVRVVVESLAPAAIREILLPVDTALKPGTYPVTIKSIDNKKALQGKPIDLDITLVPRAVPNALPVIAWGHAKGNDVLRLKEVGFTHYIALWQTSSDSVPEILKPTAVQQVRTEIDRAFALGMTSLGKISVGHDRRLTKHHPRINREGVPFGALNGLLPEVQQAASELGQFVGREFGDLPSLAGVLIDTEVRDAVRPSFSQADQAAYKAASNRSIPPAIRDNPQGIPFQRVDGFPTRRVVDDEDPILSYYRWFWKEGDGWLGLHNKTSEGLKEKGHFWTWHDPAVRAPSLYRRGTPFNYLSQWSYTYPDPLKVELAGNELLAMAAGAPQAKVMNMTQTIWYRSQTAPIPKQGVAPLKDRAAWENNFPDAKFISIAPDHLSEALWLKLSEPVDGILYHGVGSLIAPPPGAKQGSYAMTNPEAEKRFTEMIHRIATPLGPVLRQVPSAPRDVAFLESFASQIFAGRGTYGWGQGWGADSYMIARYAGLEPKIIYDETIVQQGLDCYKVLFLTHCDVLTRQVAAVIKRFQDNGGIIIGDEFLCPEIQPDILLPSFRRASVAKADKTALLAMASTLNRELAPFHPQKATSSNPEVLLKQRGLHANYLFAINDHRDYGNYVGAHKLVMEAGLPSQTTISWGRTDQVIYDLISQSRVPSKEKNGATVFEVNLNGGEGTLLLALEKPVENLTITSPDAVTRGTQGSITIDLKDGNGDEIPAVVPMEITVRDPKGNLAEQSGSYGAANGSLTLALDIASNDFPGEWKIEAKEGVSGKRSVATFVVN